jgi:hypothetical protein
MLDKQRESASHQQRRDEKKTERHRACDKGRVTRSECADTVKDPKRDGPEQADGDLDRTECDQGTDLW